MLEILDYIIKGNPDLVFNLDIPLYYENTKDLSK